MREGLSARAHTMPESTDTSPDWMPWVISGRSAARLRYGRLIPPSVEMAVDAAAVFKNRRRDGGEIVRMAMSASCRANSTPPEIDASQMLHLRFARCVHRQIMLVSVPRDNRNQPSLAHAL